MEQLPLRGVVAISGGKLSFRTLELSLKAPLAGTVTTVGDNAFSGCMDLVSAILPDSVATLGRGVFYGCAALESVTLPKGITAIPENTFRESGLKSYTVPQSVKTIGT